MGLKYGFAGMAAQKKLFVSLNSSFGYGLAQVRLNDRNAFELVFPDGNIGVLRMAQNRQLELAKTIRNSDPNWTPSPEQVLAQEGKLPKELIMFEGSYQIKELLPLTDSLPPPLHMTDEARFKDPKGVWEEIVALSLQEGPPRLVG